MSAFVAGAFTATASAAPMSAAAVAKVGTLGSLTQTVLASYSAKDNASDPRYFSNGLWVNGDTSCWTCNVSPGVAAGALGAADDDDDLVAQSVATFNRAIDDNQHADGSFYGTDGRTMAGIDTAFFLRDLGVTYLELSSKLSASTKQKWSDALSDGADYLIAAGHTKFYVNGNINLLMTEDLYLAWRASGAQRFADAYQASWTFTMSPPQPRWNGYGLVITKAPTQDDGSDGKAYLTESSGSGPGFDPAYTQVQADDAASLWVVSHDPRALRLAQMLVNTILPRVDATGTYDASGGSRKDLKEPFITPALAIVVRDGGRSDLEDELNMQVGRITAEYRGAMGYTHQNYYRGMGSWLSTTLTDFGVAGRLPAAPAVPATTKGDQGGDTGTSTSTSSANRTVTTTAPPAATPAGPKSTPAAKTPAAPTSNYTSTTPTAAPVFALTAPVLKGATLTARLDADAAGRNVTIQLVSAVGKVVAHRTLRSVKPGATRLKLSVPAAVRKAIKAHKGRFVLRVKLTTGSRGTSVQRTLPRG